MLGLFAFFYGCLHFSTYVIADRFAGLRLPGRHRRLEHGAQPAGVGWRGHLQAAVHHIGFTALMLMLPLAHHVDGRHGSGGWAGKRWQTLHRLVYAPAICGVMHYWWLVKADVSRPLIYALVVAVLLGIPRLLVALPKRDAPTGARRRSAQPRRACSGQHSDPATANSSIRPSIVGLTSPRALDVVLERRHQSLPDSGRISTS